VKSLRWASVCAFVLSLVPSLVSADEPPPAAQAQRLVEDRLVKPLADFEAQNSRFSRSRPIPHERRVRVTQTTMTPDKAGRPFMAFAVDIKFAGGEWRENDIVGCAYTKSGELFVKRGDDYRPAAFLLGKNGDTVAGVCQAAPPARS
jgi:hypothetical protein